MNLYLHAILIAVSLFLIIRHLTRKESDETKSMRKLLDNHKKFDDAVKAKDLDEMRLILLNTQELDHISTSRKYFSVRSMQLGIEVVNSDLFFNHKDGYQDKK